MQNMFILLQAAPAAGQQGGGLAQYSNILMLVLIVGVFYFFMIRPQMKKQKEAKKFMENIKKGDKVITIGGIHAKIAEVQDSTFIIEVEGGVRLKVSKSAISMDNSASLNTNQ